MSVLNPENTRLDFEPLRTGGQQVGMPEGFIILTHTPTGQSVKVFTGVYRSQHRARNVAVATLELLVEGADA